MGIVEAFEKRGRRKRLRTRLVSVAILVCFLLAFAIAAAADASPASNLFLNNLLSKCELDRPVPKFITYTEEDDSADVVYGSYVELKIRLGKDIVCPSVFVIMPIRHNDSNKDWL